MKNKSNT